MNKIKTLILSLLSAMTLGMSGQTTFGMEEVSPYFSEYLRPTALGLATGMGGGWAQRAKTHKTLGFSVSFSAMLVNIPDSELDFNSSKLSGMEGDGYQFMEGGNEIAGDFQLPTFASGNQTGVEFRKDLNPNGGTPVEVPAMNGQDLPYSPNLSVQLAVGLPKNTELIVRFVPNVGSSLNKALGSDAVTFNKLSLWGVGVKHDIKQWIPVISKLPIIEVSALLAYSQFNFDMTSSEISLNPSDLVPSGTINDPFYDADPTIYDNQGFDMHMNSLVGSILIGANIPVVHPFVGFGFNRATITTGLTGNYPELTFDSDLLGGNAVDVTEIQEDAIRIEDSRTFVNLQAGINVKIAFFSLHAQYTYQEYSMYSGGIAIGIR